MHNIMQIQNATAHGTPSLDWGAKLNLHIKETDVCEPTFRNGECGLKAALHLSNPYEQKNCSNLFTYNQPTAADYCERKTSEITTLISPRSQSVNLALQYVGWQQFIDQGPCTMPRAVLTVAPVASTSFRPDHIAQSLFGETILNCSQIFRVSGSQTARKVDDWLADYFGLPTDYQSAVQVNPHNHTLFVDINAYLDLSYLYPELFAILRIPVAHTRWDVSACEKVINSGTNAATAGYFSNNSIARNQLVTQFTQFMNGTATVTAEGLLFEPLHAARIACHAQKTTAVAEVRGWLGYRFFTYRLLPSRFFCNRCSAYRNPSAWPVFI